MTLFETGYANGAAAIGGLLSGAFRNWADTNTPHLFRAGTEQPESFVKEFTGLPDAFSARSREIFRENRASEISWRSFSIQALILKRYRNAEFQLRFS